MTILGKFLEPRSDFEFVEDYTPPPPSDLGMRETKDWDARWLEVHKRYQEHRSWEALDPEFFSTGYYRWGPKRFIHCATPHFALNAKWHAMQTLIYRFASHCKTFIELGCGSGALLYKLARERPEAKFHAYDASPEAVDCVNDLCLKNVWPEHRRIEAFLFQGKPEQTCIITVGSLELQGSYGVTLGVDLALHHGLTVLHSEPIFELYRRDDPAREYHKSREYLTGYWPWLHAMQSHYKIRILLEERTLGSPYQDNWLLAWRVE